MGNNVDVRSPMPGIVVDLNVRLGDDTAVAELVRKWGQSTVRKGACVFVEYNVP